MTMKRKEPKSKSKSKIGEQATLQGGKSIPENKTENSSKDSIQRVKETLGAETLKTETIVQNQENDASSNNKSGTCEANLPRPENGSSVVQEHSSKPYFFDVQKSRKTDRQNDHHQEATDNVETRSADSTVGSVTPPDTNTTDSSGKKDSEIFQESLGMSAEEAVKQRVAVVENTLLEASPVPVASINNTFSNE